MEQCVRCPDDKYANLEQTHCLQRVVTFLTYEDPLVLITFVKYKDTPIVKANNHILSYILLISLVFCFLCSLFFIGHPNQAICILQQITFGVFFTEVISTVLAKTITVVMAFKLTTPGRRIRGILTSGAPNLVIPICTLIKVVLCGIWLVTSPPFIDRDIQSKHGKTVIICNKGSTIAFHVVLGYLCSLALGSFTVAFLARNLPDRFNEAKFLNFSILVFSSVWITFLPIYHSTRGKIMVVVEVFSLLASSAGLLGCIFFPKCNVILVRPDTNFVQKL
ncbi:Vomeronasal 2, receptor 11 [Apodemus speciosus]|uniref:Vomeronasal 2, receptor 11 n=1 Tax=Apodemus speciosus TaxID=105296 RepID=A0ABQ0F8Z9_APOSI